MTSTTLPLGARLGPYEIAAFLAAGGMGEVYRARDVRLDRTVAIKILPAHLSADLGRRERFTREARLLSTLNHPHIRALYDIGYHDGVEFLVMEYLDGETLDARLARRPLSVAQTLTYGVQIAQALDAAHGLGIAHRDIKPANIMLTPSGVKLLDFGVARIVKDQAGAGGSREPKSITDTAALSGTTPYMAPEQLEGHEGDPRSDVFALGVTLYEMLAGRRPFEAPTRARVIAAILDQEPAVVASPRERVPQALQRLVMKCLAKDSNHRWQTARDLASELDWIAQSYPRSGAAPLWAGLRPRAAWLLAAAAMLVAVLAVATTYRPGSTGASPSGRGVIRFVADAPQGSSVTVSPGAFTVSPDGRYLAFIASSGAGTRPLWLRSLDSFDPRPLRGTEDAWNPFWSPDSSAVAFRAGGKLKKVDILSNTVQTVSDLPDPTSGYGAWSPSGVIVFTTEAGLFRVPASGGTPQAIALNRPDAVYSSPEFLPDGRHFLYHLRTGSPSQTGVYVGSLDSTDRRRVLDSDSQALYAESGHLVFIKAGSLFAHPFNPATLQLTGESTPIPEFVSFVSGINRGAFSISRGHVLAYRAGVLASELLWFDRAGRRLGSLAAPGPYINPAISNDGARVAFTRFDPSVGTSDVWVTNANGSARQLTATSSVEDFATWSPDGRRIVFASNRSGRLELYHKEPNAGASDPDELLSASPGNKMPFDWTRDGRFLLYIGVEGRGFLGARFWLLPAAGDRKPLAVGDQSPVQEEGQGQISPDGRWLAYVSDVTGSPQVMVRPFPQGRGRWLVSTTGGFEPKWRGDGRELFYLAPDQTLMSVEVRPGTSFVAGTPRPLFRTVLIGSYLGSPFPNGRVRNEYAVTPDGQRFLINQPVEGLDAYAVRVLANWQELLAARN